MSLSVKTCKAATCPEDKTRQRLTDAGGLYLEVSPAGSKRWFWKYYFTGKEKRLALGGYPEVSLKTARSERDKARLLLQAGSDPAHVKQITKLQNMRQTDDTFEAVAREFHDKKASGWADHYGKWWIRRLEKDAFPWIGKMALTDITAPVLLQVLRRVEGRGAFETTHTLCRSAGQVLRYGIQTGRCSANPATDLQGALKPINAKHVAALVEPEPVGDLLREIATFSGQPTTKAALNLSAMLFQRPGNIRMMEWAHIDLDGALWTIPSADMKRIKDKKNRGRPHLVPLASQAVAVLRELQPLTGHGRYVFPSLLTGERPMSENTLRAALRRMGYSNDDMTPHGFRAMARTIMVEKLSVNTEVIEAQLAHGKSGPLGAAYDRAEFMMQRHQMMQRWADYLDELRAGGKVLPFRAA
jgi:integrase